MKQTLWYLGQSDFNLLYLDGVASWVNYDYLVSKCV